MVLHMLLHHRNRPSSVTCSAVPPVQGTSCYARRVVYPCSVTQPSTLPRLSFLDRFLPVWILLAMGAGLAIGRFIPAVPGALGAMEVGGISLPLSLIHI